MESVLQLPAHTLTVDDLDAFPEGDGHRYELYKGTLIVSSSPSRLHQLAARNLIIELSRACTPEFAVLPPLNVGSQVTNFEPDVVVIDRSTFDVHQRFGLVPVLAIEVRSPSTATIDRTLKRAAYAELGVPHYWMVDADSPSIVVLELFASAYEEVVSGHGDVDVAIARPFPVTLNPARLTIL